MARHMMLGLQVAAVVVAVMGVLAMAQSSLQMGLKNPLHDVIKRLNQAGPYYGLVLVSDTNEQDLLSSNAFTPSNHIPSVLLGGRTFNVGKIKGSNVVYVKTGGGSINAAATTQLLIHTFDTVGIVHYGSAGGVNNSLLPGDVVAPSQVAFTGAWKWKHFKATTTGQLKFGAFNYPEPGNNTLGSIDFQSSTYFTISGEKKTLFWLPINSTWSDIANDQLQDLELQQCVNTTACLPRAPRLIFGYNASSSDIYLLNRAYREYLYRKLHIATVDEEAVAIVSVAYSNEVPVIVFRGVSNTAGASTKYAAYNSLGSINAVNAAVSFIAAVSGNTSTTATY